jgi:hypothetical protein
MFWAAFSGATRRTGLIPLFGNPEAERMVLQALLLILDIVPRLAGPSDE